MNKGRLYDRKGPYKFANICKDEVLAVSNPTARKDTLHLGKVEVGNSSGADASCGFGYTIPTAQWKLGHWDEAPTDTYTDDTTDAQDAGANDVTIGTDTVDDDGIVITSGSTFNVVGITVGTAETGTAGTYAYQYWNGSAWATLTTLATPDFTGTGDTYLIFLEPHDWAPLETGDAPVTAGATSGHYAIKVYASTAATTTAPIATIFWLVNLLDYVEIVGDGKSIVFEAQGEYRIPGQAPIVPYCSTADAANWCLIEYRQGG